MNWYKWKFWFLALGKTDAADTVIDSHVWERIWRTNFYLRSQKCQVKKKRNTLDICLWPDGHWCFWEEKGQYLWKSDDYEILEYGSQKWEYVLLRDGFIEGDWW